MGSGEEEKVIKVIEKQIGEKIMYLSSTPKRAKNTLRPMGEWEMSPIIFREKRIEPAIPGEDQLGAWRKREEAIIRAIEMRKEQEALQKSEEEKKSRRRKIEENKYKNRKKVNNQIMEEEQLLVNYTNLELSEAKQRVG